MCTCWPVYVTPLLHLKTRISRKCSVGFRKLKTNRLITHRVKYFKLFWLWLTENENPKFSVRKFEFCIKSSFKKGILNRNVRWLVSPLPLEPPENLCLVHLWHRGLVPSPAGIWNQHLCKACEHRTKDFWKHNGATGLPLDFQQCGFWASPLFHLTLRPQFPNLVQIYFHLKKDFGPFFSTAQLKSGWWLMHLFQPQSTWPPGLSWPRRRPLTWNVCRCLDSYTHIHHTHTLANINTLYIYRYIRTSKLRETFGCSITFLKDERWFKCRFCWLWLGLNLLAYYSHHRFLYLILLTEHMQSGLHVCA